MLLQKLTLGIVPESFIFDFVLIWIKLGKIRKELWIELGLAAVVSDGKHTYAAKNKIDNFSLIATKLKFSD